jgi:hypothetical protein
MPCIYNEKIERGSFRRKKEKEKLSDRKNKKGCVGGVYFFIINTTTISISYKKALFGAYLSLGSTKAAQNDG